jgi:hypothetical protein
LLFPRRVSPEIDAPKIGHMARSVAKFCRINAFSYASKLHYASLNIMFLTACKYGIFHATASASLNKYPAVLCFAISSGREACLSELNVKLRG